MEKLAETENQPIVSDEQFKTTALILLREGYWNDVNVVADEITAAVNDEGMPDDMEGYIEDVIQCHPRITMLEGALDCLKFSNNPNAGLFYDSGVEAFDFRYGIPFSDFAFYAFKKDIIQKLRKAGLTVVLSACLMKCGTR